MSSTRQDAWTQDEDLLLAEIVLRHIREGGTQLQAFEEVGKQMNRTAAACGFRWNSFVRKQYKSGIELAKKQRKERKIKTAEKYEEASVQEEPAAVQEEAHEIKSEQLTLKKVVEFLRNMIDSEKESEALKNKVESLSAEKDKWKTSYEHVSKNYERQKIEFEELKTDYNSLLAIMEKARKMAGI